MRSLMARSMRTRPMRYWFSISSPTARTRRLPRWSMSSIDALAVLEIDQVADRLEDVALGEDLRLERLVELELVVQLQAADLRQVVALGVEEQVVEQRAAPSRAWADRPGAGGGRSP